MKGVRFTKQERSLLSTYLSEAKLSLAGASKKEISCGQMILAKLDKAETPDATPTTDPGALERALLETAGSAVVATTPSGYGRVAVQGGRVGATPEQMRTVGRWLARQSWITEPMTILTVLGKWPDWYPKAAAATKQRGTRAGLSPASEGLGVTTEAPNLGQATSTGGQTASKGRTTPGFR